MFRLQNNVPEVYVTESRDFQLFCRLYDTIFGATKFNIDSMLRVSDSSRIFNSLLPILQTKVGFFTKLDISEEKLRLILDAFPYLIRYKNSQRGLNYTTALVKRLAKDSTVYLTVTADSTVSDKYTLIVSSSSNNVDFELIEELLHYVLPSGYKIIYQIANTQTPPDSDYNITDYVEIQTDVDDKLSRISNVVSGTTQKKTIKIGTIGNTKVYNPKEEM